MPRSIFRFTATDRLDQLFRRNADWAKRLDPAVLASNAKGQAPPIYWIACSDSRTGEQALDLLPGEVFAHRNPGNLVLPEDLSIQAGVQLAMDVVGCKHIIVCGHTGCMAVATSLSESTGSGPADAWLNNIRAIREKYKNVLEATNEADRANKLSEINVIEQVWSLLGNDIVKKQIKERGVEVHGVIYDVASGLIRKIDVPAPGTAL